MNKTGSKQNVSQGVTRTSPCGLRLLSSHVRGALLHLLLMQRLAAVNAHLPSLGETRVSDLVLPTSSAAAAGLPASWTFALVRQET